MDVPREGTEGTELEELILLFTMEQARAEKKSRQEESKCQCMAAELIKLHYYDKALETAELELDVMRMQCDSIKTASETRHATAEQVRDRLLAQVAIGWTIETEMRAELASVTNEWTTTSALVARLQRRVNNLVHLGDVKTSKLLVAEHKLDVSETECTMLKEIIDSHERTIQDMKTRFVDMRGQRDTIKTERDCLSTHYEQVIRELNSEKD